jgi:VanZ family protein
VLKARVLAPLAWMAVIFYFSSKSDPSPGIGDLGHIVAHFTEYFALASLWAWALVPLLANVPRALALTGAICVLYAISDEWHQSFVPNRDSDPVDVLVDSAGVITALALSYWWARRRVTGRPERR